MGCPPVRGDNPRALASGLSYVQADIHGITILYHLYLCKFAHGELLRAKVGKGGIICDKHLTSRSHPSHIKTSRWQSIVKRLFY